MIIKLTLLKSIFQQLKNPTLKQLIKYLGTDKGRSPFHNYSSEEVLFVEAVILENLIEFYLSPKIREQYHLLFILLNSEDLSIDERQEGLLKLLPELICHPRDEDNKLRMNLKKFLEKQSNGRLQKT